MAVIVKPLQAEYQEQLKGKFAGEANPADPGTTHQKPFCSSEDLQPVSAIILALPGAPLHCDSYSALVQLCSFFWDSFSLE